ncbi:MAG: glycoside hydrolase family 76 protein [Solirubrobacteraceae bacterium]
MQRHFFLGGPGLYREVLDSTGESFLWPFSQALAATVSVANIRGERRSAEATIAVQLSGLERYLTSSVPNAIAATESLTSLPHYTATTAASGLLGTSFYDDNDWVGIELARIHEQTGSPTALALAQQLMTFEMDGWDASPGEPCPGGIPHSDAPGDEHRSTISTAPAAELALQLYRITGSSAYLSFAEAAYGWVRQCLLGPEGLYADHLEADGETDPELWSYTQGAMIGAGALLYQATGQASYLEQAYATAQAAAAYFTLERMAGENPFFVSVYMRNLLYLDSILHSGSGRVLAQEYVAWAWESLREPDGLILASSGAPTVLLGQSGVVQIYALLSTSPSTYF